MRQIWKALAEKSAGTKKPQPSTIRLEQLAKNSAGVYEFPVKKTAGNVLQTEIRLDENDAFFATHARVVIKMEDPAKPGTGVYLTYPNNTVLTNGTTGIVVDDVEAIFNSKLNIAVNSSESLKALSMQQSRCVRTTQQSALTNRSEQYGFDGFVPLNMVLRLSGADTTIVRLDTPSYTGKVVESATAVKLFVAVEFLGFLVPGGSAIGEATYNF